MARNIAHCFELVQCRDGLFSDREPIRWVNLPSDTHGRKNGQPIDRCKNGSVPFWSWREVFSKTAIPLSPLKVGVNK